MWILLKDLKLIRKDNFVRLQHPTIPSSNAMKKESVPQGSEPEFKPTKQEGKHSTHFGYQKQVYQGLHSEGNRFD